MNTTRSWFRRATGLTLAAALLLGSSPAYAAPRRPALRKQPDVPGQKVASGTDVPAGSRHADRLVASMPEYRPASTAGPEASRQVVTLDRAPSAGREAGLVRAGRQPVWVGRAGAASPHQVRVAVLDRDASQRAGVDGALLELRPAEQSKQEQVQQVAVRVDLEALDLGGGGDWLQRAQLVSLPACATTSPERPECQQQTPLAATRSASGSELTSLVTLEASASTVVAAAAGASGSSGDFRASPVSPSATWTAGGSSGGFSWSYPIRVPEVAGDVSPALALSYSSDSVDGRTASTNNQPSWVGEGWDLGLGSIERSYRSCEDDMGDGANNPSKRQDLCWAGDNATASFGARSGRLVQAGTSSQWRLEHDDGTRFEKLTGALDSGDNDKEYWKVTTTDGTQYYFGRGRATAGSPATNSSLQVPVFGNHGGEPCHGSSFAGSWCQQTWRWNLDHVVDVHGNTSTAYYAKETNRYGRNNNTGSTAYNRASYLTRIDYGQRDGQEKVTAPAKVTFDVAERCVAGGKKCDSLTKKSATSWPDVPQDQLCSSTTSCSGRVAPTFFSRKRLVGIKTWYLSGSSYAEVERWTLSHKFPDPGDGTSAALWLTGIVHAGAGGTSALPPVTFGGVQLANRVDGLEDTRGSIAPPLIKWRVKTIDTESGGELTVAYSGKDCTPKSLPSAPQSNARRCFPTYWSVPFADKPSLNWFHKYVVTSVTQNDLTDAASVPVVTRYAYDGGAGWTYDDNKFVKAKHRTWSQWNGYGRVRTIVGSPGSTTAQRTDTLFYRGLDGDRAAPAGGTKSVKVTDSEGTRVDDARAFKGETREEITYNGPIGAEVEGTISDVAAIATTATDRDAHHAVLADVTRTRTRTRLSDGSYRRTQATTRYDDHGFEVESEDLGDLAVPADDRCTRTTYSRNVGAWLLDPVQTEQGRATRCADWPSSPTTEQVLGESRHYYDGLALGAVARGDETRTETARSVRDASFDYATEQSTTFDAIGREVSSTDALGARSTTAYTPSGNGVERSTTTTSPDPDGVGPLGAHVRTVTNDLRWGAPVTSTEPDGATTEATYDALGRLTQVWEPGRSRARETPSTTYAYTVAAKAPTAVTTRTLLPDGSYRRSTALVDGLLRAKQSQTQTIDQRAVNGVVIDTVGRLVTDTVYDDRGLAVKAQGPTLVSGAPSTSYVKVLEAQVPTETVSSYDGAGRVTKQTLVTSGTARWSTTTAYGGDRVMVTPPAGGTATTTITDVQGRTTALRQHTGGTPTGGYDESTYAYTPSGQLATMTDAAGNTWRHSYDLRGREVQADDPDAGRTTKTYDLADRLLSSTDARGETLAYGYDALGRKTSVQEGAPDGPLRSAWAYDAVKKGHLASSTRYVEGQPIVSRVTSLDAAGRPLSSEVSVPEIKDWVGAGLAKTYKTTNTYFGDGSPDTTVLPAVGSFAKEEILYSYDSVGRPFQLLGEGAWVAGSVRSAYGDLLQTTSGQLNKSTWSTWEIDQGTGRTKRMRFDRETHAKADYDTAYAYNDAGAVTKIATTAPESGEATDTQCFSLDHVQRLVGAWTPGSGDCRAAPSTSTLGGPAPYWQEWAFDKASNRTREVSHAASGDTTTTWALPAQGGTTVRPHGATAATTTAPGQGPTTSELGYDAAGNVTARSSTAGAVLKSSGQSEGLTYDAEGRLAAARTNGPKPGETRFAYDADGSRLLRSDAETTTLYLGDTELTLTKATGSVAATRYYTFDGRAVAVRDGRWNDNAATLWSELNNTGSWQVNWDTLAISTKRSLPYGGPRGTVLGALKGQHGFVDGLDDPDLGLVRLGARDYDPASGRFLSVDPVLDPAVPQQWNPYGYGNGNPVLHPDPGGLEPGDGNNSHGNWAWGARWNVPQQYRHIHGWGTGGVNTYNTVRGRVRITFGWRNYVKPKILHDRSWEESWRSRIREVAVREDWLTELKVGVAISSLGRSAPVSGLLTKLASASAETVRREAHARSEARLLDKAREARDQKASEVGSRKATVTGGYDKSGRVVAGCNRNPTGCAEDDVARQLGGDPRNVRFTEATRPRTGREVPVCASCQAKYDRSQFPPGIKFDPTGRWGVIGK